MDRSHRRRLPKGTSMTPPSAARDCKAFLAGLSLSVVLGCSAFKYLDSGLVSAPTSINTGVNICEPAETKRNIAVTLSQR